MEIVQDKPFDYYLLTGGAEQTSKGGVYIRHMVMPHPLIEIYLIILTKGFKPSMEQQDFEGQMIPVLALDHPKGTYRTAYRIINGKFKWFYGVEPFRILK